MSRLHMDKLLKLTCKEQFLCVSNVCSCARGNSKFQKDYGAMGQVEAASSDWINGSKTWYDNVAYSGHDRGP